MTDDLFIDYTEDAIKLAAAIHALDRHPDTLTTPEIDTLGYISGLNRKPTLGEVLSAKAILALFAAGAERVAGARRMVAPA